MLEIVGEKATLCNETFLGFCARRRREVRDQIPPMRSGYEAFAVIRSNLAHVEQAAAIQSGVTVDQETGRRIILPERSWKQPLWVGLAGIGMTCIAAAEALGLCLPDPEPEGFDRDGLLIDETFVHLQRAYWEEHGRRVYADSRFRSCFEALGYLASTFEIMRVRADGLGWEEELPARIGFLSAISNVCSTAQLVAELLGFCRPEPGPEAN